MSCPKTNVEGFPHHWGCIETNGHSGCICNNDNDKWCSAHECRLKDGSRRVPDGSIVVKSHLEAGGIALASHNISTGEVKIFKY
jgi:hypothetical protein